MNTGDKISKARKDANLTQDQLAELLDVSRQTVSKWESNLACPELSKIVKLSDLLGLSCDQLLRNGKETSVQVSLKNANTYEIDWTKLCPILGTYQKEVDPAPYTVLFTKLMRDMQAAHRYSLEDSMLVLKDLFYQTYLALQAEEKQKK